MAEEVSIAELNWSGKIPVQLTLAPTSVSSPTIPPPLNVLVPRQSYLHVALESAIRRFHPFAPVSPFSTGTTMLKITEPDPGGENEQNDGEEDLKETKEKQAQKTNDDSSVFPICWLEDEETQLPIRWHLFIGVSFDLKADQSLPWKIKLHFTNYPQNILPMEGLESVHNIYKHSLKQALSILSGNSKTAMNLTRESHSTLWEAVKSGNYKMYQSISLPLSTTGSLPIRLILNNANPPIQHRWDGGDKELGDLLKEWLSDEHFLATDGDNVIQFNNETVSSLRVCGIENPPLNVKLSELCENCSYPDQFLYIVVLLK